MTPEELARMEQEMAIVSRDFKAVEATWRPARARRRTLASLRTSHSTTVHRRKDGEILTRSVRANRPFRPEKQPIELVGFAVLLSAG